MPSRSQPHPPPSSFRACSPHCVRAQAQCPSVPAGGSILSPSGLSSPTSKHCPPSLCMPPSSFPRSCCRLHLPPLELPSPPLSPTCCLLHQPADPRSPSPHTPGLSPARVREPALEPSAPCASLLQQPSLLCLRSPCTATAHDNSSPLPPSPFHTACRRCSHQLCPCAHATLVSPALPR